MKGRVGRGGRYLIGAIVLVPVLLLGGCGRGGSDVAADDAAAALLEIGTFSYRLVAEGGLVPGDDSPAVSDGQIDLDADAARYSPMINPTGNAEIRLIGLDLYGTSGDGSWTHSRRDDDQTPWIEEMPLSGFPLLIVRSIAEIGDQGSPASIDERPSDTCTRFEQRDPSPGTDGLPMAEAETVVACHSDGVLTWVRSEESDRREQLTVSFDHIGDAVDVVVPSENVTEFETPDVPPPPSPYLEDLEVPDADGQ